MRNEALLRRLRIPLHAWDVIAESWKRRDPSLYGRFDLAYDGAGPAKLLEYNADTPTSLVEAAVAQWHWLEQLIASGTLPKNTDQYNSLHEKLIERWRAVRDAWGIGKVHVSCVKDHDEDWGNTEYLRDCALQAGLDVCAPLYAARTEVGDEFEAIRSRDGLKAALAWRKAQFRDD